MKVFDLSKQATFDTSSLLNRNKQAKSGFDEQSDAVPTAPPISSNVAVSIVHRLIDVVPASDVIRAPPKAAEALKVMLANIDVPSIDEKALIYATLDRDGKTIATFYKDGQMMTPGSTPLPSNLASDGTGRELADKRVKQMLMFLGGDVNHTA